MTLIIPINALQDAQAFFEEAGSKGLEGTGFLAGTEQGEDQLVGRFFAPEQRASSESGCWVEVTDRGKAQLAAALSRNERWIARIHSHPGEAFHSATDDANPVLTNDGAWSIVVPYFGLGLRRGIEACAVHCHRDGSWHCLTGSAVASLVWVIS
jgi:proteasome lid subunit RPN8/RPN11